MAEFIGTPGDDTIYGLETEGNTIDGGAGDDYMSGSTFDDKIYGRDGDDFLFSNGGADILDGGLGSDTYFVSGEETLVVETELDPASVDRLFVEAWASTSITMPKRIEQLFLWLEGDMDIVATNGDNLIFANDSRNEIHGLDGDDYISAFGGDDIVHGGAGKDMLFGDQGTDQLYGGAGNDGVMGGDGNDFVSGGLGNDTLYGDEGNDQINGGEGNDRLAGSAGNDILFGGEGSDTFVFDWDLSETANVDVIRDFDNEDDTINLHPAYFTALQNYMTTTLLAANFAANDSGTAQDANDYIVYNTRNGSLYYDEDGSGAGAAIKFATLNGAPTLKANDFVIY